MTNVAETDENATESKTSKMDQKVTQFNTTAIARQVRLWNAQTRAKKL